MASPGDGNQVRLGNVITYEIIDPCCNIARINPAQVEEIG